MGGSSGSSTSTYSPPPEVAAAYKQLLSNAQPLFTAPYQPYTAGKAETAQDMVPLTVAPQTPNQVAAGQNIASLAGYYQPYANAATDLIQQGSQPIQLQQFNNQSVGQYMSPFMQNVMGSTVANINETNAQQQQQVLGNAIAKGAYGGDRAGIAQSELARQQNLANNATLANIANTGYNSALGQFNQMNQQGIQAQLGSGQLAQSGAQGLGNLGTMGQNAALQQAQAQYGIGGAQQQQKQAELSTAYQNYLNQIAYPYQQAQFEGGLISGVASGSGGTTTSTPAQPGAANQIIGGLGALGSLGSLFGGGGGAAGGMGGFGSMLGGIGSGLGAAATGIGEGIGAAGVGLLSMFSDERMKENIHPVGKTFDGQNIYKYNYKGDPSTQIGLIAQEVEHKHPSAVGHSQGYKTVNYDEATKSAEHRGHFAAGGDVQQQQGLLGVSPIAGMAASSYLPTGQTAMATPHMPQAPTGKHPNDFSKDQLSDAVKGIRTLMGKPDPTDAPPPVQPISPLQQDAFGGRIHHYGVGGVADAPPDIKAAAASSPQSASFDALRASQQKYTQTLPNAGVMPAVSKSTGAVNGTPPGVPVDPNAAALKNPALARSNYSNLANSGNASLADLQSAYDIYMRSHATPEAITQVQMGSGTPDKPAEPVAESQTYSGSEGGSGGGNASGGRIHEHHFGTGGGIVNYIGMPTKKSAQEGAESIVGSGTSGGDPTLASIASQDYLPEQAARGGVIGREHHAGPDETNGESNVVGKAAGVAAVAPEEGAATGVPRKNYGNFHPEFATRFEQFVKRANEEGIPIKPGSGFRDANEQAAIYADKQANKRGSIQHLPVAPPYASGHQYGLASDFSGAKPSHYGRLNEIATEVGLNYGGKFDDPIHVQYGPNSFSELRQHAYDESGKFKPGFALPQDWADRSKEAANAPYPAGLVGAKPSGVVQGAAPQGQSQGQEQPRQGPMQLNQTATKEGLSGMLGISMTDNQRLAAFNAFARMAGTPGKFGMGLAAAADTYSKTLMEANKQQREGYTAESEAKLRAEQAAEKRITQKGLTTQIRSPADETGKFTIENQIVTPGSTTSFGGQGNVGAAGSPSGGQSGTENAPQAPVTPQQAKEISLLGPRLAGDESNPLTVLDQLAKEAIKNNAMNDTEARAMYQKEFSNAQTAAKAANSARGDLASTVKAVSELPSGGLTGFGPGSEARLALARTVNAGLRTFGDEGFDENNITQKQILDKVRTLAANEQGGSAAAKWLSNYADAFPNGEQTEQAAKTLTAKLLVQNTQHLDYARVAQAYGAKSLQMGYDVTNAMEKVNPSQLYVTAQNDLTKLMVNNSKVNPSTGKLWNPVSALANGDITPEQFNEFAMKNGSKISNLSRFVLGQ